MDKFVRFSLSFIFVLLTITSQAVYASIVITGTRVIYPSSAKEVSVKLMNTGKRPVLIQSWIDDGDIKARPEKINVPFVLTPPINRVEPEKGQTLRISYTGKALPTDRESLYWLNVLEVPAKDPALKQDNYLQVAFRSRIKFFFRPANLNEKVSDAIEKLTWTQTSSEVAAENPTPYYISLVSITINGKKSDADMIAPFSKRSFKAVGKSGENISVFYVNDYGAVIEFKTQIK